jgi:hypothetical protein
MTIKISKNHYEVIENNVVLKSSKTIYPCLKFIRAEEKFEIKEIEVLCFHTCGKMLIDNQPHFKFSLENALNYKRI